MSHQFPKIIWQTHNYKKESLPKHINQAAATWKNLNPGWEYRYIDHDQREEQLKKYPEIYQVYKNLKPQQQCDIWRFITTYEHGGCYADIDSVCIKPLDYLIESIGGDPEIITVPEVNQWGNNHNYIVKEQSKVMSAIFNRIMENPSNLILSNEWECFNIFTSIVYFSENVSKELIVGKQGAHMQDLAADHSQDYKTNFEPSQLNINYYGEMMNYVDFLEKNNLSSFL